MIQAIFDSALDRWALYLDGKDCYSVDGEKRITADRVFLIKLPNLENIDDVIQWMMPARSIAVAKYLSQKKKMLSKANEILKQVVNSDKGFFNLAAQH